MDQGALYLKKRRLIWLCKQFRNSLVPARNAGPIAISNNEVRSHALRAQQGNQAFLRGSASGARKRHPNLPVALRFNLKIWASCFQQFVAF
jgi:hypothetical protein